MSPRMLAAAAFAAMIAVSPAAAHAAGGDDGPESIAPAFIAALSAGDMHAFDGIASVRPIGNWGWGNLMTFAYYHPCVSIDGYRVTLEPVDATRARLIIDVHGTGSAGGEHPKPEPIQTPWTLGLVKTDHGWRIEVAILTAYDLTLQYVTGDHLWWQACVSEEELPPALFAYKLADEASSYHRSYERCARAIDHAEAFAREGLAPNVVAFCAAARTRLAWSEEHYSEAAALGREAVAVSRTIGDPDSVALALFALGLAQWKNDEVPAALQSLDDAVSMREQLASRHMAFRSQLLIAYIHLYQHEYREAIAASRKAVELSEAAQWHEGIIQGNLDLAEVHSDLRDFEAARRYGDLALALARKDHARGPTLQGLQIIAGCDMSLERWNDAEGHLREAMQLTPINSGESAGIATSYAAALLRLKKFNEADEYLRKALAEARRVNEGVVISNTLETISALRLAEGRAQEAADAAHEALEQPQTGILAAAQHRWTAQLAFGRALRQLGQTNDAIAALQAAVSDIEGERGSVTEDAAAEVRYFKDKVEAYTELVDLLVSKRRNREAFAVAEQMRGRVLVDALTRRSSPAPPLAAADRRQVDALEGNVAKINRSLIAATARADEVGVAAQRRALDEARASLDRLLAEVYVARPEERIRHMASERVGFNLAPSLGDVAVIEYVVRDRRTIVFALRRTHGGASTLTVRRLSLPRMELMRRVERLCQRFEARDLSYAAGARELYDALIGPIEPSLRGVRSIAIIPDGELWRLPFQALAGKDGRFLVERAAVFYAPSLTMLQIAAKRPRPARYDATLLAFGNPVVNGSVAPDLRDSERGALLGPLPDAEREVRAVAALYPARQSRVYIGSAAKESTFKEEASHFRILHVATHGLLDDRDPMYSALLFASDDLVDDGLLETREIMRMRLNAGIVILAACDTGRGETGSGEGVIGLSWAFLLAGCPTTLVTQRKANSRATAELMLAFHRGLRSGATNAQALRRAQLAMIRSVRDRHPFYWAPFVLVGMPF